MTGTMPRCQCYWAMQYLAIYYIQTSVNTDGGAYEFFCNDSVVLQKIMILSENEISENNSPKYQGIGE